MKLKILKVILVTILIEFALILLGGPGYRLGLWGFRTGLGFVFWAIYVAPVAFVLSLVLIKGHRKQALINVVLSLTLLLIPIAFKTKLNSVPFIHDITTDLEDPPQFKWVGEHRKLGDHPLEYDKAISPQQGNAYPDIKTFQVPAPAADTFDKAKQVIEKMKWKLVNASERDGQLEATHTSFLYGFKDDIVVRIRVVGGNTVMDLRSQSRVGLSDLGANAARIRTFLKEFQNYK